jgi:spore germination cell wall hydrolase CwlJ-like protein
MRAPSQPAPGAFTALITSSMNRFNVPAGVAALAISLASVFAPVEAQNAFAQASETAAVARHTQPPADELVPPFVAREVVQPVPETARADARPPVEADSLAELVASMPRDTMLDQQLECLAGAIYFEARGEPLAGQLAVAEVIVNRAASGRFPASYCGVVTQKSQFSFVRAGRIPAAPTASAPYQRAKAIAQIAHRSLWSSEARDALYFHARYVSPAWSSRRQAAARIHNHVFYR